MANTKTVETVVKASSETRRFIRIAATKSIRVTEGLQAIDMTNRDAHIGDRFRVASAWVDTMILIKTGSNLYPVMIKNWDSVKALTKEGILTLGEETDECNDPDTIKDYDRIKAGEAHYSEMAKAARTDAIVGSGKSDGAAASQPGDLINF
jgi:hypothetical protein